MEHSYLVGGQKQSVNDIDTHTHLITFFDNQKASVKYEDELTLPQLAEEIRTLSDRKKSKLPWLKMARFGDIRSDRNCLRTNANVQEITGIELDYDAGTMPFDRAVEVMRAANIRSIVYTSASYQAGVREKWRILAPLSEALEPVRREAIAKSVNAIIGGVADKASFTLSQAFYYGFVEGNNGHRVEVIDGDFVDLRPDLAVRTDNGAAKAHIVHQDNKQASPGRDDAEILQLLKDSRKKHPHGGGQWHNSMLSVTASMIGKGWTDAQIYTACAPYCDGQWGDEEIAELIESGRAKWRVPNPGTAIAAIAPVVKAAIAAKGGAVPDFEPNWRERYVNGRPKASLHNVRLAIEKTGLQCSVDVFHSRALIGRSGAAAPAEQLAPFIGEVSDVRIGALRMYLSDRFGIDFTEKHVRDAVGILCHENRFDPICDMLEEAETGWDGVARLDRMAVDYFNAADTALNRQCVRKTMIAAVKRAREPGCKFDTVLTMESREGWNKSSAWAVLAGEGNFSDEPIIGKHGKEVMEQLAGTWIHESAELSGMAKRDVEAVKAYASRMVDRARPAYGHFVIEQPRHSIEVGTTNSEIYLLSSSGNRRFWPIRILRPINLAKLKAARLQLWGEAAHWHRQGESLVLDEGLWREAGEEQEARRVKHPWEDILNEMTSVITEGPIGNQGYYKGTKSVIHQAGDEERVSTAAIFQHVLELPLGQSDMRHSKTLADVMRLLGWEGCKFRLGQITVKGYRRTVKVDL